MKHRKRTGWQQSLPRTSGRFRDLLQVAVGTLWALLAIAAASGVAFGDTLTVTTISDNDLDGLSLRTAVFQAAPGDSIVFAPALRGQVLAVERPVTIDKDLSIVGPGSALLAIDGNPLDLTSGLRGIFRIEEEGSASISGLTIRNGQSWLMGTAGVGPGINNLGAVVVADCVFEGNQSHFGSAGAIYNAGNMTISGTTFRGNGAHEGSGGAIDNRGNLAIQRSTFVSNSARGSGGAIANGGTLTLLNTTFYGNIAMAGGGAIINAINTSGSASKMLVANSTFSDNHGGTGGPAVSNVSGEVRVQNSILAGNFRNSIPEECGGAITSLGRNILGTTAGCAIGLQPSDIVGDPLLAAYVDSGEPGAGRFPLLAESPAIDAADSSACALVLTDQLGKARSASGRAGGPQVCDIGAVEFFPSANSMLEERIADRAIYFDRTPAPAAPGGTFVIVATFENASYRLPPDSPYANRTLLRPFFEAATLQPAASGAPADRNPLLLNADLGAGGVGSRIRAADSLDTPLAPGEIRRFEFRIGLQAVEPFIFLINAYAEFAAFP